MEHFIRIKGLTAQIFRNKAHTWILAFFGILLLVGAVITSIAVSRGHVFDVKARSFGSRSVVTTTDIATIPVTTTVIPTVTISVFHLNTTSAAHNFSSGSTSSTPSTHETVSTIFTVPTVTSSEVEVRNPISTASLAGIFAGIVCFILIMGGILLFLSRKQKSKKFKFWPIGTRVRAHGLRARTIQLQPQNPSHVQSQTSPQTLRVNNPHAEVQTNTHQASQIAVNIQAQTLLPSLPQTPERTIPRINVSPASGNEVLNANIFSKDGTNKDKTDEHEGSSVENFNSAAQVTHEVKDLEG